MNAIILAAGMGMRIRHITDNPKCLIKVNGTTLIERQIQFLHAADVTDITLVSGYKAEKLHYLKDLYNVEILYNDRYETCNNIYSMYLAINKLSNTYVIEGDIYMHENCFVSKISSSTYFAMKKQNYINEWGLISDEKNMLKKIEIGNGSGFIMSGISFWSEKDSVKIKKELIDIINKNNYNNLFWDNIILNLHSSMKISIREVSGLYEIDTANDFKYVISKLIYLPTLPLP